MLVQPGKAFEARWKMGEVAGPGNALLDFSAWWLLLVAETIKCYEKLDYDDKTKTTHAIRHIGLPYVRAS